MNETFRAIYSDGVLRPLTPLDLPESAVVECTPVRSEPKGAVSDSLAAQQHAAREALFQQIETMPQPPAKDGLSGDDHDQILYGNPS